MIPIVLGGAVTAGAIAVVAYLLWPTWGAEGFERSGAVAGERRQRPSSMCRPWRSAGKSSAIPGRRNASISASRFPRWKRPTAPKHVSADTVEESVQPIDRIFLSISAHHDTLAPDTRVRTIYPRYLEQASSPAQDGLTMRAFRDGTPYGNEDLFFASTPNLNARCTRDAATPGMCLSERRIDGADLTFRFPRSWLAQWRDVADAMDRLTPAVARAEVNNPLAGCSALIDQILLEDRHLELERAVVVFVVDEQHADEFLADIDLGRVVLLRPRHHANASDCRTRA